MLTILILAFGVGLIVSILTSASKPNLLPYLTLIVSMRISELRTDDRHIPPRPSPLDIRMANPLSNIANNMNRGFPPHLAELEVLRRSTQPSDVSMTAVAGRDTLYRQAAGMTHYN